MRQIKFRMWSGEKYFYDSKNVYECLRQQKTGLYDHEKYGAVFEQYTGLHDKHGKEIYEGDVIEFDEWAWGGSGNIFYVSWNEKLACWDYGGGAASDMCYRKVIGNIHENGDLL